MDKDENKVRTKGKKELKSAEDHSNFSHTDEEYEQKKVILEKIELFFCSPDYTSAIGDFMDSKAHVFTVFDLEVEQPLEYYSIFKEYQSLVEEHFEAFIENEAISTDEIFDVCRTLQDNDNGASTCLEYLLACTEYSFFLNLMFDFCSMKGFSDYIDESLEPIGNQEDEDGIPLVAASKK
mmetsp:Transcript_22908/g.29919  ORF Transcript_22908/g.29919 Transcript_22908/m.29919 type:complete len:180 (-) Transcript_22908:144-683(-)